MRTNIEIDPKLIKQVMRLNPNLKSKKDAVHFALQEVVEAYKDKSILDLAGADLIDPAYARKALDHRTRR